MYIIWSFEHKAWWRSGRQGYTEDVMEAGKYTFAEAEEICISASYSGEIQEAMVPLQARENLKFRQGG